MLQSADGWASFTGIAKVAGGDHRAFTAVVDRHDPASPGAATIVVMVEGDALWRAALPPGAVSIK